MQFIIKAYDGIQAISAIKANELHLIIMDVMMPGQSGLDYTRILRKRGLHIPILMRTVISPQGTFSI